MKVILYKTLNEGIDWIKNDDGTLSLYINKDKTDRANKGSNSVDTRVFGDKDSIFFGDGTAHKNTKALYNMAKIKNDTIKYYNDVISYIDNGRKGEIIPSDYVPPQTITAVSKWFNDNKSDNYIKFAAQKALTRIEKESDIYNSTVNRIDNDEENNKVVTRYITGTVPDTNVKFAALFSMTDFNFSDAIKHGSIRQNGNTDKLIGIDASERKNTYRKTELAKIDVKYDGKMKPSIKGNFSLSDDDKYHNRTSNGLSDEGYTSIHQFIDKSIQYAAYVLKNEKFSPDFIVSPPSSSKFNDYYCTRLAQKLGIQYQKDFFKRNFVNIKFDKNKDTDQMRKDGFSEKDIMEFEYMVRNIAYREMSYYISEPIRNFIDSRKDLFSNISIELHSREKTPLRDVIECLTIYVYKTIVDKMQSSSNIAVKQLLNAFRSQSVKQYDKRYNFNHIINQILTIIKLKIGFKVFGSTLMQVYNLVKKYSEELKQQGYELKFNSKRAKLTSFKKQFRPYLHDVYVIANDYLDKSDNLLTQYKNAKFLIFDEDINSGATMKLCIDALQEKISENKDSNIMCLANAYSASGW